MDPGRSVPNYDGRLAGVAVSLGSDIDAALPGLRAEAESRMTETVTIGTFEDGTDPDTFDPTRTAVDTRYTGKGRIRYASLATTGTATGSSQISQPVVVQSPYLSIPHGSPRIYEGDEVVVDASTSDALLVARRYQVAGNATVGQTTAHRYPLTELT